MSSPDATGYRFLIERWTYDPTAKSSIFRWHTTNNDRRAA